MHVTHRAFLAAALCALLASPALAAGAPALSGFDPEVPVSAFARPASWFDPSRLQMSTTVSVGSGFGGTTSALQVTSFNYSFGAPLTMRVSLGNSLGTGGGNGSNFFLEGLALDFRPSASTSIRIQYRDLRSPLQYDSGFIDPAYGPWRRY
jgi:hypothetical protein